MSYLGNSPELNTFTIGVEKFNGSGACTQFTLTRDIDDPNYIEVVVGGVQQTPIDAYTVTNGIITFNTPPGLGTNNVVVIYRTGTTIAYNQISASQILANSVTTFALAPNAVVNSKIAPNAITGDKLADQIVVSGNNIGILSVSGNNIGLDAISGNNIGVGAISGNNIGVGAITGNLIADTSVASNNIVVGAITGNLIGINAVSGNNLGLGSISANNFAGGGITSNVLASNLTISTARVAETINVVTSSVQGNYNVHVSNSTVYNFTANTTGNLTFNLVANVALPGSTTGRVNDLISIGQSVSVALMVKQGTTRYRANLYIDGVLQTAYWAGNTQPLFQVSPAGQGIIDVYNFSVIKIGTNAYDVFASNTQFGQANGQGMGPVNAPFGPRQ
jgi:hypothetical protein